MHLSPLLLEDFSESTCPLAAYVRKYLARATSITLRTHVHAHKSLARTTCLYTCPQPQSGSRESNRYVPISVHISTPYGNDIGIGNIDNLISVSSVTTVHPYPAMTGCILQFPATTKCRLNPYIDSHYIYHIQIKKNCICYRCQSVP